MNNDHLFMREVILEAGRMMADTASLNIEQKGANDFVTNRDKEIQDYLIGKLSVQFPNAHFIAEEKVNLYDSTGEYFVIDPIDGTHNFMNGIPICAVCLAYVKDGEVRESFVYNSLLNEFFSASKGQGAFLNGQRVTNRRSLPLDRSVILIEDGWKGDKNIIRKYAACARILGSAELGICYAGCGRAAAYLSPRLHLWDYAAGMLFAEECGMLVVEKNGERARLIEPNYILVVEKDKYNDLMAIWHESEENVRTLF